MKKISPKLIKGQHCGKWTVIKYLGLKELSKYIDGGGVERMQRREFYLCKCECGNLKEVLYMNLIRGYSKSCGQCLQTNIFRKEYSAYVSMKNRWHNVNSKRYNHSKAISIEVCDRWLNSFTNFLNDMGKSPKKTLLVRTDLNGNFEPKNCKWGNAIESAKNRGKRRSLQDEFTDREDICYERKRQLRRKLKGLCIRSCNRKIYKCDLCKIHYLEYLEYRRIYYKR